MDEVQRGYVNASYVRRPTYVATKGAAFMAGYDTLPENIVTQDPLDSPLVNFLTMLYEQRVPLVIMLGK